MKIIEMGIMLLGALLSAVSGIFAYHYILKKENERLQPVYGTILYTELKQNIIALGNERDGTGIFMPSFWAAQSLELAAILPEDEVRKYQEWIHLVVQKRLKSYALSAPKEIDYDYIIDEGFKLLKFLEHYKTKDKIVSEPVEADIRYKWDCEYEWNYDDLRLKQQTDTKDKK